MSMLERGQACEIIGDQASAHGLTHSFFARDFPGGFLNFLLILSPVRTANTHPTSPCNRSRHPGQLHHVPFDPLLVTTGNVLHDIPFQQFKRQVLHGSHDNASCSQAAVD